MIEDYLADIYEPLKAIETLIEVATYNAIEDGIYSGHLERKYAEKHMSLLFCIKLVNEFMQDQRKQYYENMIYEKYSNNDKNLSPLNSI